MTTWMSVTPCGPLDEWQMETALRNGLMETVGARQAKWLLQAKSSKTYTICVPHDREHDADRLALRRLVARGLFFAPNCMPGRRDFRGGLYFYGLTPRGATCWLRYPK